MNIKDIIVPSNNITTHKTSVRLEHIKKDHKTKTWLTAYDLKLS